MLDKLTTNEQAENDNRAETLRRVAEVLKWMEDMAQTSRVYGPHVDAYERAAYRLRAVLDGQ